MSRNSSNDFGWIDPKALGRPIKHDARHEYNPPMVVAPAMSDAQFEYDNQRQIDEAVLTNPAMMAHVLMDLRDRVAQLEELTNDRSKG